MWKTMAGIGFFAGLTGLSSKGLARRLPRLWLVPLDHITEFASGLLMAVICFGVLPEAFLIGGFPSALLGVLVGMWSEMLLPRTARWRAGSFCLCLALLPGGCLLSDGSLVSFLWGIAGGGLLTFCADRLLCPKKRISSLFELLGILAGFLLAI